MRIDGKTFYGTDGEKPHTEIASVSLTINGDSISIPNRAWNDLYEPDLHNLEVYSSQDKHRIYILMSNSDGAGAYDLAWCIVNGKYIRRVVDYGW